MVKPILYISGAITGMPDLNRKKFADATKKLRGLGYIVINPHELCEGLTESQWQQCMRRCIAKLMDADIIILLNCWQQSRGAQLEFTISKQVGIKHYSYQDFLNAEVVKDYTYES